MKPWIVCPICHRSLEDSGSHLSCSHCDRRFPVYLGIPDFRSVVEYRSGTWEEEQSLLPRLIAKFPTSNVNSLLEEMLSGLKGRTEQDRQHLREYFVLDLSSRAQNRVQTIDFISGKRNRRANFTSILEIGCGAGATLFELSKRGRAVGIEPNLLHLIIAKRHAQDLNLPVSFVCGFAEYMPFQNGYFSVVHSMHTFEHFSDQRKGLAEINRILAPGGDAFFDIPNRYSLWREPHTKIWGIGFLPRRFTAKTLRGIRNQSLWRLKKLVREGFGEKSAIYTMLVRFQVPGYPASAAVRLIAKLLQVAECVPGVRSAVRLFQPGFEVAVWKASPGDERP